MNSNKIEEFTQKEILSVQKILNSHFYGPKNKQNRQRAIAAGIVFVMLIIAILPPLNFPSGTLIKIEKGAHLSEIAYTLKQESVIRSETLFKGFMVMLAGQGGALSGDYFFESPQNVLKVARRISQGVYGLTPLRVRFVEGSTISDMSHTLSEKIPDFDVEEFLRIAEAKEGFLFPDTYFFLPNIEPGQVVQEMENVFKNKIEELLVQIEGAEKKSLEEIIIMASIIEKEAITPEDKKLVSGVLWKRIEIGMPLQVDAPFIYERNRNTFELTIEELREDSPYNTYTNRGLTPTPIANPGIESIIAAFEPIESAYLFYLSDKHGNIHYAETFEGHKRNKAKYIY
ncbi:endolytic transglycosylase MltG [Patescibacteria group bacterium]